MRIARQMTGGGRVTHFRKIFAATLVLGAAFLLASCTDGGEEETNQDPSAQIIPNPNEWPQAQIENHFGSLVPKFDGESKSITSEFNSKIETTSQITINGTTKAAFDAYIQKLTGAGFAPGEGGEYTKKITNGSLVIKAAFFSNENKIELAIILNKTAGDLSEYPSEKLSDFSAASLPSYAGGKSFDFTDVTQDELPEIQKNVQDAIAVLEAFGGLLDEKGKASLAELKKKQSLFSLIKICTVKIYETNESEVSAFESALKSAGFSDKGEKKYTDKNQEYQLEVSVSGVDEGKAYITISRMPVEFLDED